VIPEDLLSSTDVAQIRFVLVGVGLMLLLVFRPQGIFGDRREVMLDAR
jgi:branched-chain amino acid transport system permease protein